MSVDIADLEPGDGVLLRFESFFNDEVTQSIPGVVTDGPHTDGSFAEVNVTDGDAVYAVTWDGGVMRRTTDDKGRADFASYGKGGRLWTLDPVNQQPDDVPDEDMNEGDRRTPDDLIPPTSDQQ